MANPLAPNCQAFATDASGKVTGIQLGITRVENAKYEVYSVRLRDENEAVGQTIAACQVLDHNGINTGIQARLAWPGAGPMFSDSGLPGNAAGVHVISNKFTPPNIGPLAIHVGDFNNSVSDIVYGLGLPLGHHVSFDVVFREKGSVITPDPTPTPTDYEKRIANLETWARAFSAKFPQGPQYTG